MAEKSPGPFQKMERPYDVKVQLNLRFCTSFGKSFTKASDKTIQNVRERAVSVFNRNDLLKNFLQQKHGLTCINITDILPLNKDSIILKCLIKEDSELEELRMLVDAGTLVNLMSILVKEKIPTFNSWNLCLNIEIDKQDYEKGKGLLSHTLETGLGAEPIGAGKQSMAQTIAEPLVIGLKLVYTTGTTSDDEDKIQSIQRAFLNTEGLDEHFREKEGFESLRVCGTVQGQQPEIFVLNVTIYNSTQLERVINLVESRHLGKELETYISKAVSSTDDIRVDIELDHSKVNEWKRKFASRDPKQRPPLEQRSKIPKRSLQSQSSLEYTPKTFYVYIPPSLQKRLRSVEIKCRSGDTLARYVDGKEFVQDKDVPDLWALTVHVPPEFILKAKYKYILRLKQQAQISYQYLSSFAGYSTNSENVDEFLSEKTFRESSSAPIERDSFKHDDQRTKDSVTAHFRHILHMADNIDINSSIAQINSMHGVSFLLNHENRDVAKEAYKTIQKTGSNMKSMTFIAILSHLGLTETELQVFDKSICKVLRNDIKGKQYSAIDPSIKNSLKETIIYLCKRVFHGDASWIHLVTTMYPFFDETEMLEVFRTLGKYEIHRCSEDMWKFHKDENVKSLLDCVICICNRAIEGQASHWLELLQSIISSLPAEQALGCIEQTSVVFNWHKEFDGDVKKLIANVHKLYQSEISKFEKNGEIGAIDKMWRKMDDYSKSNLQSTIEDALIACLADKFLKENSSEITRILFVLCSKYDRFFRDQHQQKKLLSKLHGSKYDNCLDLFQKLIETPGFCTISLDHGKSLVTGWCEEVIRMLANNNTSGKEKIRILYEKIGSLFENCEIVRKCQDAKDDVSDLAFETLKNKTNISNSAEMVRHDWNTSEAEELFFNHLTKLIRDEDKAGRKIRKVLLKDNGDPVEVNKRKHALLCVALMEMESCKYERLPTQIVRTMVENGNFWMSVLTVQGMAQEDVRTSHIYRNMIESLRNFISDLNNQMVNEKTFNIFSGFEKKLFIMYDKILGVSSMNSLWDSAKAEMMETMKIMTEITDSVAKLRSLGDSIKGNFSKTCDCVIEQVLGLQKQIKEGKIYLSNVLKKEIFKNNGDTNFHLQTKWLSNAIDSRVFLKINQKAVMSFTKAESPVLSAGNHQSREDFEVRLLKAYIFKLHEQGKETYIATWAPFIEGTDIQVQQLQIPFESSDGEREIMLVTEILKTEINPNMSNALLNYLKYTRYIDKLRDIKFGLETFGIDPNHTSKFMQACENVADQSKLTLLQLSSDLEELYKVADLVDEGMRSTLKALENTEKSLKLIGFLRKVLDEDMSNLANSVDEFPEYNVTLSTVSSLIDVKVLLKPLLPLQPESDVCMFLSNLNEAQKSLDITQNQIESKIADCLLNIHGVSDLYKNMANTEERTKEIIQNIIEKGRFKFSLVKGCFNFTVTYSSSSGAVVTHTHSKLSDVMSQALLIMNSKKKNNFVLKLREQSGSCNYGYFTSIMDQAFGIFDTIKDLHESGHDQYQEFDEETDCKGLLDILKRLQQDFDEWDEILQKCRTNFPVMNYVYGTQIQQLYQFFIRKDENCDVLPILQFINRNLTERDLRAYLKTAEKEKERILPTKYEALRVIANSIQKICSLVEPISNHFPFEKTSSEIQDCVKKGRLYIARLQEESDLVTRVVLSLYLNTTLKMPNPDQILLCDGDTCWNEIYLLLQRCKIQNNDGKTKELFCIAHVELLPSGLKTLLAEELQSLQNNPVTFLAVIIRCNVDNPFLSRFREYVMSPGHLSEPQMRQCLGHACPYVKVYSSDNTGLGKSEAIREMAHTENKAIVTVHISGPFNKNRFVQKLCQLHLKDGSLLHIDIGPTKDAFDLDMFLFRLIFLRIVSAGTMMYSLQTNYVCLELANTCDHSLENLPHVKLFQSYHISGKGFSEYNVSTQITSNVQVVCQYLKCKEENMLDLEDIYFTGENAREPLSKKKCQDLLSRCFKSTPSITFPLINTFISVLAVQLKRLSMSTFFRTKTLAGGMQESRDNKIKHMLVQALVDVSKTFATKSVQSTKKSQMIAVQSMLKDVDESIETDDVADDMQGMIRWEDSNHLIILFQNKDSQTVTALFKDLRNVPQPIVQLFKDQGKTLTNIDGMNQMDQQRMIIDITCSRTRPVDPKIMKELSDSYALTTDNILKMVLIWLRIQANIPVIVIGETGCGKTSLITYLSKVSGVETEKLHIFNIHAGVDEKHITNKIQEVNALALKDIKTPVWVFFDEINTTDNVGLLGDIICHRKLCGKDLAPNLVLLAACNPYKMRHPSARSTTGLQGKLKIDKLSHLVYRVHPLPQALFDYVWDFGSLSEEDERKYIRKIVHCESNDITSLPNQELFVALISESQSFVRREENCVYSVSLRDVSRCQKLSQWFASTYQQLKNMDGDNTQDKDVKAMILSLAHCYYCRFPARGLRRRYLRKLSEVFNARGIEYSERSIEAIIIQEQSYILNRMDVPKGTAKNEALQENVFMILVSALNRIPLFLVGKPGCSKSLSMQLIKSNVRGKDSKNDFFGRLPRIMWIAFQGSESCTSDGIIKVFEKAQSIQRDSNVLPLVILDEIGLADISQFNPLKVLHSLLEPVDRNGLDVAVVGISNWALDAAKMNRAIHLCRPDMDYEDVVKTSVSIVKSFIKQNEDTFVSNAQESLLQAIARAYIDYTERQHCKNFHGLRDFYSLIKFFSKNWLSQSNVPQHIIPDLVNRGISRNFGGRRYELDLAKRVFYEKLKDHVELQNNQDIPICDLIRDNILDQNSRHLMLISSGDAIMSLLGLILDEMGREYVTIIGSHFEEDQTDDYNYRNLSQIILCMEQGKVLILKDLEGIFGSLYDMLNQNYTEFAQKKHCRVALGEYSNPMCHVANTFKCIVLLEESALQQTDPPFLSRFEKQHLLYADLLPESLVDLEKKLDTICSEMSTTSTVESSPKKETFLMNFFPITGKDITTTLILSQISQTPDVSNTELYRSCLDKLLYISKPEAILQLKNSEFYKKDPQEASRIIAKYLRLPLHGGLKKFLDHYIESSSMRGMYTDTHSKGALEEPEKIVFTDASETKSSTSACEQGTHSKGALEEPDKIEVYMDTSETKSSTSACEQDTHSKGTLEEPDKIEVYMDTSETKSSTSACEQGTHSKGALDEPDKIEVYMDTSETKSSTSACEQGTHSKGALDEPDKIEVYMDTSETKSSTSACEQGTHSKGALDEPDKIEVYMDTSETKSSSSAFEQAICNCFESKTDVSLKNMFCSVSQAVKRILVLTHSSIHSNIPSTFEVAKISHFKSKKSFEENVSAFWSSEKKFLILQFEAREDLGHLLLVKTVLNASLRSVNRNFQKHIVIVLHLTRNTKVHIDLGQKLNFLSEWDLVYLDNLEEHRPSLPELSSKGVVDVISDMKDELPGKIGKLLFWSFTRLSYATSQIRSVSGINAMVEAIQRNTEICNLFASRIVHWISHADNTTEWVLSVASDAHSFYTSSSLIEALEGTIDTKIGNLLCKLMYMLEETGALDCVLAQDMDKTKWELWKKLTESDLELWKSITKNDQISNMNDVPDPEGPCSYPVHRTVSGFKIPFFIHFFKSVEAVKSEYFAKVNSYMNENSIDSVDELTVADSDVILKFCQHDIFIKLADLIQMKYPSVYTDYEEDFFLNLSVLYSGRLSREMNIRSLKWIVTKYVTRLPESFEELVASLHTTFWLYAPQIFSTLRLIDTAVHSLSMDLDTMLSTERKQTLAPDQNACSVFNELVENIFRRMIPSSKILGSMSVPNWQRKINGLFCLSNSIGVNVSVEHILRFCHDFAVLLHLTYTLDHDYLQSIGEKLSADGTKWESREMFEFVFSLLKFIQQQNPNVHSEDLQRTLCMYIYRCFDADHEDDAMTHTIELIKSVLQKKCFNMNLIGFAPPLVLAMGSLHEISKQNSEYDSVFFTLLQPGAQTVSEYELLKVIDECLKEGEASSLGTKLVAILQKYIYSKLLSGKQNDTLLYIASDEGIYLFMKAVDVIYSSQSISVRQIAAIAFFRTFSEIFNKWCSNIKNHDASGFEKVCNAFNSTFGAQTPDHSKPLSIYFLRCLEDGEGMRKLNHRCGDLAGKIKACNIYVEEDMKSVIDLHPLVPHCAGIFQHFQSSLESAEHTEIDASILYQTFKRNEIGLCILSILHCNFIYRSTERPIRCVTKSLVNKAYSIAKSHFAGMENTLNFVDFLTGASDLRTPKLKLSSASSEEDFYTSSVITQFVCQIFSQCNDKHVWMQMICAPDKTMHLLLNQNQTSHKLRKKIVTCNCGHRVVFESNECPLCKISPSGNIPQKKQEVEDANISLLLSNAIVDFLVNGCFLTSIGIGHNPQTLHKALKIPEQNLHFSLQRRVERNWNLLKSYLGRGNAELGQFFQVLFWTASHLFYDYHSFQSEAEWIEWKNKLTNAIKDVLNNELDYLHNILTVQEKELKTKKQCLEKDILLSQNGDTEIKTSNMYIRFAVPSPSHLHGMLCLKSKPNQFPLLELALKDIELLMPLHLLPSFIAWHTMILHTARFVLKKSEVKTITVSGFIKKCPLEKQNLLEKSFNSLEDSWNELFHYYELDFLGLNTKLGDIDSISRLSSLADCIVLGRDSVLFKIIDALVVIQNQFLDNVLDIACTTYTNPDRHGCPAVSFVNISPTSAAIRSINVLQVTEEDVIHFNFEDVLMFSECGLTPNDRKDVNYDFSKIQLEIALQLFGKRCITIPTKMPTIQFADDLYQNSIQMLEEIGRCLKQEPIEKVTEEYLCKAISDDPSLCKDMLTFTGILLALLQNSDIKESVALANFISGWENVIPRNLSRDVILLPECNLYTCHLVSLYKFLEETDGGFLIGCISQCYRDNLKESQREVLDSNAKLHFHKMKNVFRALKITLHRCTFLTQIGNQDEHQITRQQRICDTLDDRSIWAEECLQGLAAEEYIADCIKCIPQDVEMKQFYATISFILKKFEAAGEGDTPLKRKRRSKKSIIGKCKGF